ncbi:MAG: hypothetical protein ACU0BS_10795 [Hasllibacter sp.]
MRTFPALITLLAATSAHAQLQGDWRSEADITMTFGPGDASGGHAVTLAIPGPSACGGGANALLAAICAASGGADYVREGTAAPPPESAGSSTSAPRRGPISESCRARCGSGPGTPRRPMRT